MLTHREAKNIVDSADYYGVNKSISVVNDGCYYFTQKGLTDFMSNYDLSLNTAIISAESLTEEGREFVEKFIRIETATRYLTSRGRKVFFHDYRRKSARVRIDTADKVDYYRLRDDEVSIAIMAGMRFKNKNLKFARHIDTFK